MLSLTCNRGHATLVPASLCLLCLLGFTPMGQCVWLVANGMCRESTVPPPLLLHGSEHACIRYAMCIKLLDFGFILKYLWGTREQCFRVARDRHVWLALLIASHRPAVSHSLAYFCLNGTSSEHLFHGPYIKSALCHLHPPMLCMPCAT